MRLDKINAFGGTFILICGVLLYLSPDNLNANSILIQSAGIISISYLVSVLVHFFIRKQMNKDVELVTVYAWYSSLVGLAIVITEIISLIWKMVGPGGLEPPTNGLWVHCSNQLSYRPLRSDYSITIINVILLTSLLRYNFFYDH